MRLMQRAACDGMLQMGSYLVTKCGMPAEEAAKCFEKSRAFRLGTISMTDKAPQGYYARLVHQTVNWDDRKKKIGVSCSSRVDSWVSLQV